MVASPAPRRAVYTALMGGYETLLEQPVARETSVPFICFTDDPTLTSSTWEIRLVRPVFERDPIRSARAIKIRGAGMAEFDETLWIDNTVLLSNDPASLLDEWLADADFALPLHSYRATVEAEFHEVAAQRKDEPSRIYEQLMHYREVAPELLQAAPLWTALLARRRTPEVAQVMDVWLGNVLRYSRRDQLSVVMALSCASFPVNRVELDNHESPWHAWPMAGGRKAPSGTGGESQSLEAEVARLRHVIDTQVFQYTDAVTMREDALRAMAESTSWRVTAPLRAVTTSLRALRGRLRRSDARLER